MFAWFDNSYWLIVIWIWQVCHLGLDVGDLSLREHFIPNTVNQEETCGFCWLHRLVVICYVGNSLETAPEKELDTGPVKDDDTPPKGVIADEDPPNGVIVDEDEGTWFCSWVGSGP